MHWGHRVSTSTSGPHIDHLSSGTYSLEGYSYCIGPFNSLQPHLHLYLIFSHKKVRIWIKSRTRMVLQTPGGYSVVIMNGASVLPLG